MSLLFVLLAGALIGLAIVQVVLKQQQNRASGRKKMQGDLQRRKAPEKRDYTAEEVSAHTQPDDLWLIIDGKVYDFSEYAGTHPGGEAIFNNAGKDSSKGFHGEQHPSKVQDMLEEFLLGNVVDEASSSHLKSS